MVRFIKSVFMKLLRLLSKLAGLQLWSVVYEFHVRRVSGEDSEYSNCLRMRF
jgi:hypothetical protein